MGGVRVVGGAIRKGKGMEEVGRASGEGAGIRRGRVGGAGGTPGETHYLEKVGRASRLEEVWLFTSDNHRITATAPVSADSWRGLGLGRGWGGPCFEEAG